MPVGYRFGTPGSDFDDLFEPGTGPTAPNLRRGAAALQYAPLSAGSKRGDVGYRVGGQDVSNLWAAKGSVQYVTDGGLPPLLTRSEVGGGGGVTARVEFQYGRNGVATWASDNSGFGTWAPGGATAGDPYDIRYTAVSGTGGNLAGVTGNWQQVNSDRSVSLTVVAVGGGSNTAVRVVRVEIRRRSDSAVLVNRQVQLEATATSDG